MYVPYDLFSSLSSEDPKCCLPTSLQICNAGFLIPASQRGRGFGSILARSYLHYGPRLGYEASVFNLVYVNNIASVK